MEKIAYLGGAPEPSAVFDIGGQCQVQVIASQGGTYFLFDGPNGELKFRVSDEDWSRLVDLYHMTRKNAGVFDWSKYCRVCKERNDFCPNRGECKENDD